MTYKNKKGNSRVKSVSTTLSKIVQSLHPSYLQPNKNQKVIKFKLDEYTLHHRAYFLSFINFLLKNITA